MDDGGQIITIVLLAMVALFIGLRLRSVLGRRTDDPVAPPAARKETAPGKPPSHPEGGLEPGFGASLALGQAESDALKGLSAAEHATLKQIFRPLGHGLQQFLNGAKAAYEATLKGFWAGDMGDMEPFLDEEVAAQFKSAISEQKARREVSENRLVEVSEVKIEDVHVVGPRAEITLKFSSEIIAVVKDRYGKLIEGDLTDTILVVDIWTFARNLKNKDPNWTLVATQAG